MEVKNSILTWLSEDSDTKYMPLGHNYGFDKEFLKIFFGDYYDKVFHYKNRDTHALAIALMDSGLVEQGSTSLSHLCDKFDILHKPHDAFGDTWATLQLYKTMINIIRKGGQV